MQPYLILKRDTMTGKLLSNYILVMNQRWMSNAEIKYSQNL
jgi:hypothetical protein